MKLFELLNHNQDEVLEILGTGNKVEKYANPLALVVDRRNYYSGRLQRNEDGYGISYDVGEKGELERIISICFDPSKSQIDNFLFIEVLDVVHQSVIKSMINLSNGDIKQFSDSKCAYVLNSVSKSVDRCWTESCYFRKDPDPGRFQYFHASKFPEFKSETP
ncbi:hypothetical protein OSB04_020046 [Centaurea solstitialis]|uniref:Uncharacterized protein n=1 Tax=Centaurea solstitialis TaxID=347529 RepID=A0AA38SZ28_9ASTR|nr:hypothetical protein OSB04_020046 [Centaurea solstitialis]